MANKLRLLFRNWNSLCVGEAPLRLGRWAKPLHTLVMAPKRSLAPVVVTIHDRKSSSLSSVEPEESLTEDVINGEGKNETVVSESDEVAAPEWFQSEEHMDSELSKPFEPGQDAAAYQKGTFQYLFENSLFAKAMDPVGKEVEAEVLAVVEDKLYVDFGCKFHAVVPCPDTLRETVHRGTKVIVVVEDLEVTQAFIGKPKHTSLLEAQAEFVRLKV